MARASSAQLDLFSWSPPVVRSSSARAFIVARVEGGASRNAYGSRVWDAAQGVTEATIHEGRPSDLSPEAVESELDAMCEAGELLLTGTSRPYLLQTVDACP
jgi:hypothetical protein